MHSVPKLKDGFRSIADMCLLQGLWRDCRNDHLDQAYLSKSRVTLPKGAKTQVKPLRLGFDLDILSAAFHACIGRSQLHEDMCDVHRPTNEMQANTHHSISIYMRVTIIKLWHHATSAIWKGSSHQSRLPTSVFCHFEPIYKERARSPDLAYPGKVYMHCCNFILAPKGQVTLYEISIVLDEVQTAQLGLTRQVAACKLMMIPCSDADTSRCLCKNI